MENFLNKIQGNDSESEASSCHEDELSLLRAENAMLSSTVRRYRRVLDDVERVLGQYFAGLEPKILDARTETIVLNKWEVFKGDHVSHDTVSKVEHVIREIDMHPLLVDTREELREVLHIRASLAGKDDVYSISDAALCKMPKSLLVRHIAETIARQLVSKLTPSWRNDND